MRCVPSIEFFDSAAQDCAVVAATMVTCWEKNKLKVTLPIRKFIDAYCLDSYFHGIELLHDHEVCHPSMSPSPCGEGCIFVHPFHVLL